MSSKNLFYLSVEDFYLQPIYSCIHCRANLAHHSDLISKSFQGSQGRAYLFNNVVNVGSLVAEERMLLTGLHYVADIYCECCSFILGWKYERAFEPNQRYKEGKYIIEQANLIKDNGWDVDYPSVRRDCSKVNRRSFSINWDQSSDSISKSSLSRPIKSQSRNTFIKDLSRDFQYLFGFYDKNNVRMEQDVLTQIDVISVGEEVSNPMASHSIDRVGMMDILRKNSDSDIMDSLTNSLALAVVDQCPYLRVNANQDSSTISTNESAENSSLNTSYNSSKGLLGASCSSEIKFIDVRTQKLAKSRPKKSASNSASITQCLPSYDTSLSVVSGTSCSSTHATERRHTRHKHRSRHSSNVVNPQKGTVHRRHRSTVQPGDAVCVRRRPQDCEPPEPSHHK